MGTHPIFESDFNCLTEKKMSDNLRVAVLSLIVGFILGKIAEKLTTAKDENDEDKEKPESGRSSMLNRTAFNRNKRVSISYTSNDELDNAPRRRLSAVYDKEQLSSSLGPTSEEPNEDKT